MNRGKCVSKDIQATFERVISLHGVEKIFKKLKVPWSEFYFPITKCTTKCNSDQDTLK